MTLLFFAWQPIYSDGIGGSYGKAVGSGRNLRMNQDAFQGEVLAAGFSSDGIRCSGPVLADGGARFVAIQWFCLHNWPNTRSCLMNGRLSCIIWMVNKGHPETDFVSSSLNQLKNEKQSLSVAYRRPVHLFILPQVRSQTTQRFSKTGSCGWSGRQSGIGFCTPMRTRTENIPGHIFTWLRRMREWQRSAIAVGVMHRLRMITWCCIRQSLSRHNVLKGWLGPIRPQHMQLNPEPSQPCGYCLVWLEKWSKPCRWIPTAFISPDYPWVDLAPLMPFTRHPELICRRGTGLGEILPKPLR